MVHSWKGVIFTISPKTPTSQIQPTQSVERGIENGIEEKERLAFKKVFDSSLPLQRDKIKYIPFSMAIKNAELIHECCPHT